METRFRIGRDLLRDLVDDGYIKRYDAGAHARYRADELEGYLKRYHVSVGERR